MIVKIELWARHDGGQVHDVSIPDHEMQSAVVQASLELTLDIIKKHAGKMTRNHRGVTIGDVICVDKSRFMLDRDGCYLRLSDAT